jgi:hypothetical protein
VRQDLFILAAEGTVQGQEMQLKYVQIMENSGTSKTIFGHYRAKDTRSSNR